MSEFFQKLQTSIEESSVFQLIDDATMLLQERISDEGVRFNFRLALEEFLLNLCHHSNLEESDSAEVIVSISSKELTLEILDGGAEFDPFSRPDPDLDEELEDRPIGGLGIFLVGKTTSTHFYERVDGMNRVSLSWNLS